MAASNRTTLSSDLTSLVPTIDWGAGNDLQDFLNTVLDSVVLNRDVTDSDTVSSSTYSVDFSGVDTFTLTINFVGTVTISITNLAQGEAKFLKIVRTTGGWTFTGVYDETFNQDYFNTLSEVFYLVANKDGTPIVYPLTNQILSASAAEIIAGNVTTKFITPLSYASGARNGNYRMTANISYSVGSDIGSIHIVGGVTSGTITLPDPADCTGQEITIYSSGGSGVKIEYLGVEYVSSFTANWAAKVRSDGFAWVRTGYYAK